MKDDIIRLTYKLEFNYDEELSPGELKVIQYISEDDRFHSILTIHYNTTVDAFKALGTLAANIHHQHAVDILEPINIHLKNRFKTLGFMIDCSRNAVPNVQTVKEFLLRGSLLGFNLMMLYTEDTYPLPGRSMFGYMRGGFTKAQLQEIDDYGYNLGVEVVPCIQTLGHLAQILQWPKFQNIRDTHDTLLCHHPETYELISEMLNSISECYRTKKIHLGMDEAYGVGEGRYKGVFGNNQRSQMELFLEHLGRVQDLCFNMGFEPMIWSDMLFCLQNNTPNLNNYYDMSMGATALHHPNLQLVYWDYYHINPKSYRFKIEQHHQAGCPNPWIAAGCWNWNRLWSALPFAIKAVRACLEGCIDPSSGVENFLLTSWGDEGNEGELTSCWPEMETDESLPNCYPVSNQLSFYEDKYLQSLFETVFGANLIDFTIASLLDELTYLSSDVLPNDLDQLPIHTLFPPNPSKCLLWEDPLLSFLTPQYHGKRDLNVHYEQVHLALLNATSDPRYSNNSLLTLPTLLAKCLSLKCSLWAHLKGQYSSQDFQGLKNTLLHRIEPLIDYMDQLRKCHRSRWHILYKPFGWEIIECRYGGQITRLRTLRDKYDDDPQFQLNKIEELEIEMEEVYMGSGTNILLDYHRVHTPSANT
ncbi:glycoside hydrolase family 20 protein [Conidiobolus coronatus NRRL 28638]|uniref:beta-N-acetylhexosaminidase n=1 Tax=Conidiobolus coronatus (strain ATCC 28846 / CBS 209.66 / NRRL 28638) TaxID=796925 RepID=A0A137P5K5_CONC2|nr:glycoside hydrolase family 20 protein [Conidiobolus coronatus NRRL 28638]|eukprot:KXN70239.1 glycoside hydrolase family 20 protein [Conidiobolus coronatus NRRL 28638]